VVNFGCWLPLILAPHIIVCIGVKFESGIHNNWRPPWGKGRSLSSVHHGYQRLHLGDGSKHGSMEVYGSIEG
jgi:hypothetical protein